MKDKTVWQEVLNRGKWVIILLVAFVLSQFPIGLALFLANKQFPILQSGLLVGALSIVVLIVFIIGARKTQLATFNLSFFKAKDLARLVLSYLVIFATNLLGSLLLRLTNEATTSNQSILNGLVQNSSLISTFFLLVLIAPICEEIFVVGLFQKRSSVEKKNLALLLVQLSLPCSICQPIYLL